jgi:hypothetical protein
MVMAAQIDSAAREVPSSIPLFLSLFVSLSCADRQEEEARRQWQKDGSGGSKPDPSNI